MSLYFKHFTEKKILDKISWPFQSLKISLSFHWFSPNSLHIPPVDDIVYGFSLWGNKISSSTDSNRFKWKLRNVCPSKVTTPLKVNIHAIERIGLSKFCNNFIHVELSTFHILKQEKIMFIIFYVQNRPCLLSGQ